MTIRLLSLPIIAVATALALTACGGGSESTPAPAATETAAAEIVEAETAAPEPEAEVAIDEEAAGATDAEADAAAADEAGAPDEATMLAVDEALEQMDRGTQTWKSIPFMDAAADLPTVIEAYEQFMAAYDAIDVATGLPADLREPTLQRLEATFSAAASMQLALEDYIAGSGDEVPVQEAYVGFLDAWDMLRLQADQLAPYSSLTMKQVQDLLGTTYDF